MSPSGKAFAESYGVEVTQQSKVKLVTGEVYDDQGPVIGATVMVKGTTNGQITDVDGKFSLRVPVGATIVVSFVGYEEKEIVYKGEERLRIPMSEDITQLQEVQVIAYGTTKKVTVTGALSSVGTDEILKSPVGSVGNALAGKVPGLSAVQSSGQPGADDATLYVRGVGSLSTGLSTPLCLVDGVERSFTQIDPNEIEDITVLKDASATAVFGVRGANGVILVTTKRGQEGKAKVTFSTSMSVQMPTKIPEFANSYEYATTYNQAQLRDGVSEDNLMFSDEMIEAFRTHSDPILYPDVDWTDLMIKNAAWQTQHNLTISGGSDRVRYFASLGVFTQDGLFETFHEHDKGFKYNRYNYRINMDIDVTKTTTMQINLGGRLNQTTEPNYNNGTYTDISYLYDNIYSATPFSGAGIVDGRWITSSNTIFESFGTLNDGLGTYYGKGYNTTTGNTINFDFQLEQKLDFLTKGLKAHVKGAYNSGVSFNKRREGRPEEYEAVMGPNGEALVKKTAEQQTQESETETAAAAKTQTAESADATRPQEDRAGNPITVPEEVDSIISLAPATTQILCDLGLADEIVAVDTNSPQYAEGLAEDVVQFDMMEPDLEQILNAQPDIIFVSNMSSQGGDDIFAGIREAGICVAEIPTSNTIEDVKKDVQFTADCVGKSEEGAALVEGMEAVIDEVSAIGQTMEEKKTVLFEISPVPYLYSFGTGVYLNEMIELIGAQNVLADQEGWLSVTEESAVAANPDVILTSDNFSNEDPVAEILGRAGWENVTAVKDGAVAYIDNAASSLPNHHIVDALKEMAKAVYPEEYAGLN